MTRVCSNDPTHDIGAAGPTGGFCPVCGRRIVDVAPPISGATDDLTEPARPPRPLLEPDPTPSPQKPRIETRPPSRITLYLIVAAVVLAAGIAAFASRKGGSATHEVDLPDNTSTTANHVCAFQNVVVSFRNDGIAHMSGRASGKHGISRIGFRSLQMSIAVSATLQAGLTRNIYTAIIPALVPSAAPVPVSQHFSYDASLFPKIDSASIDVQCSP